MLVSSVATPVFLPYAAGTCSRLYSRPDLPVKAVSALATTLHTACDAQEAHDCAPRLEAGQPDAGRHPPRDRDAGNGALQGTSPKLWGGVVMSA